jgi:plastocyanin
MASTTIIISSQDGALVPSQPSVPAVNGDTITFSAQGVSAILFFSPGAIAILNPSPSAPVTIAAGGNTSFTFTSSSPGAYSVYFEPNASSPPASFPVQPSNLLLLEIDTSGVGFGGPGAGTKTGS